MDRKFLFLMAFVAGGCSLDELSARLDPPRATREPAPPAVLEVPATPPPPAAGLQEMLAEADWGQPSPEAEAPEAEIPPTSKGGTVEGDAPTLVSIGREAWVYSRPTWRSKKLGYLRAGSRVPIEGGVAGRRGCKKGWRRISPRGYVCVGKYATTDLTHPVAQLSTRAPNRAGLPYPYVASRFPTPPLYARLPSLKQQRRAEPERAYHLRKYKRLQKDPDFMSPPPADPVPEALAGGALVPGLGAEVRGKNRVVLGQARVRSGFALLANYEHEGRRFGLTTELALIPLDRTRVLRESTFHGVVLSEELELPIGFVRAKHAYRYLRDDKTGLYRRDGKLARRSVVGLTGKVRQFNGAYYLETRAGAWVRHDQVAQVKRYDNAPRFARQGKRWIDVSILRQTLVAYEGRRPVFATLVSTGADGIGDPKKTHSTIQGTFLIHTKHVSVTMDGDERGDEFDLRDVPYVQYFTEGYALHAAYWHDDFGTPRSHGCVNLAPRDAAWLFDWTTPDVPEGWHAALSLKTGTVVHIHP